MASISCSVLIPCPKDTGPYRTQTATASRLERFETEAENDSISL